MPVAEIPEDEVTRLKTLHTNRDLPSLRRRISLLRSAGWTLSGIGVPMEVPFSTVRAWQTAGEAADPDLKDVTTDNLPDDVPTPARPPRRTGHTIRVKKIRPDVPAAEREELYRLSQEARILRRSTAKSHPAWKSQQELESMLRTYRERGVPTASLARHCKVTNRAITARMERADLRQYKNSDQEN